MAKAEWGTKHICQECGAKFYDMRRAKIICPKCHTVFQIAPPKPKRVQPVSKEPAKEAKPAVEPAGIKEAVAGGGETDAIDELKDAGAEDDDIDDDDEDVIEDTSDLGNDDDDMPDVIHKTGAQGES
ncbi:MAG: TIGR02300 family protein [Alphaproteobacteria bacterium]|nr:TIGR02300 family protein [Alphaproteobacteria bacterium]